MEAASGDAALSPWRSRWVLFLGVMVVGFFALSLWAGVAAYLNFQLSNSTDAGIITQTVWSTSRGGVPPFYEAYDCLMKGRCSFLLVHPAFLLYAEAPALWVGPATLTLFAIRAAVVALAAVPLFWLTRQLTGSDRWALLAAGMYLVWAPTSADDFSLHMEAYLPLEILLLVALWQARRYRWGLAVAFMAFITIEIAPVLTFLVGVFFLVPLAEELVRGSWARWKARATEPFRLRSEFRRWWSSIRAGLRQTTVRYSLALMAASAAAYVVLYSFMNVWGARVLGVPAPGTGTGLGGLFYNSSTPPPAPISAILTSPQTIATGEYWLLLYALLAFLPLLSLRALVLSVPWIGWTFLSDSNRFTTLGHQYSFIAAGPLFVGLAYGLEILVKGPLSGTSAPANGRTSRRSWSLTHVRRRTAVLGTVVGVVVVANVLFLPFNPVLPELGYAPRSPVGGNYFDHTLEIIPGFQQTEQMVALVPSNATIAAPSALYALAATHREMIVLEKAPSPQDDLVPFNYSGWPEFVLLYSEISPSLSSVKAWGNFSNGSMYGMRAYVASTGIGSIFLYEQRFSLPAQPFGPALPSTAENWTPTRGLLAGTIAREYANSSSPSGSILETNLSLHRGGLAWTASVPVLAPGNYSFTAAIAVTGVNGTLPASKPVFEVVAGGFGRTLYDQNFTLDQLQGSPWAMVTWNSTLLSPLPGFEVQGILRSSDCSVAVAQLEAQVLGPP